MPAEGCLRSGSGVSWPSASQFKNAANFSWLMRYFVPTRTVKACPVLLRASFRTAYADKPERFAVWSMVSISGKFVSFVCIIKKPPERCEAMPPIAVFWGQLPSFPETCCNLSLYPYPKNAG